MIVYNYVVENEYVILIIINSCVEVYGVVIKKGKCNYILWLCLKYELKLIEWYGILKL